MTVIADQLAADVLQALMARIDAGQVQWQEAVFVTGLAVNALARIASHRGTDEDSPPDHYHAAARAALLRAMRVQMK